MKIESDLDKIYIIKFGYIQQKTFLNPIDKKENKKMKNTIDKIAKKNKK